MIRGNVPRYRMKWIGPKGGTLFLALEGPLRFDAGFGKAPRELAL